MANELELRLKADRAFVEYLCEATGQSASAIATGAGMAPTTLNRFLSKKIKLRSTLKDITIRRIAETWGLDHLDLITYRKKIEDALRAGKTVPAFQKNRFKSAESAPGRLKEPPANDMPMPARDPLMDQIMSATYDVWFHSDYKKSVAFERLPDLVRLLYGRMRMETKKPVAGEIRKRAADMLAVAAMEGKK